jgi:hypothetical protein
MADAGQPVLVPVSAPAILNQQVATIQGDMDSVPGKGQNTILVDSGIRHKYLIIKALTA